MSRMNYCCVLTITLIFIISSNIGVCSTKHKYSIGRIPDAKHPFRPPGATDVRGPCPGLNTAANHGYINRSGIVGIDEVVKGLTTMYNIGEDLAVILAVTNTFFLGNPETGKFSIGHSSDETGAFMGIIPGGLNEHNTLELDASLTRNDYDLANGDNWSFNGTLYGMMHEVAKETSNGLYTIEAIAAYRRKRYQQSRRDNKKFFFDVRALHSYGAATFLYEVFPSAVDKIPSEEVISSFFGAQRLWDHSGWMHKPERIPYNWYRRLEPYTLDDIIQQAVAMYRIRPVEFGWNIASSGQFFPSPGFLSSDELDGDTAFCLLAESVIALAPTNITAAQNIYIKTHYPLVYQGLAKYSCLQQLAST
ncbi:unnamed protein product [Didymodactylos carnosus]|uniref:Heme haloperoxidase family profile domain-containing protein n=1 Tax=Didymodactylos carnosus TaxID=1234261 RepID=A0A8S2IEL1_9BILA|nr:unnamed protein product [Didymodactylos carnosus]CAF3748624.1 unnamed protein product [Didymodactylos carnosus]